MGQRVFVIGGKRTPFGKFGGSLKGTLPVDLAVNCTKQAMEEASINPEEVDQVILGNVIPSSTDTLYGGRHLALKIGCKQSTPGITINRLCGSGIEAIVSAGRLIQLGEAELVVASGTENMSMTPHLTYGGRFGTKYGALKTEDLLLDALTDKYAGSPMGITAENLAEKYGITREECDQFSLESHKKAAAALENGHFKHEIAPIELKRGVLDRDEHVRAEVSIEEMRKLRASFKKDGTVTPATASGIVDGASTVIVASESYVNSKGIKPLAEVIGHSVIGVDPNIMGIGPVDSIRLLLDKTGMSLDQIDLVEINEAFAAQALACVKELGLDQTKLNIWGGATAIGHPLAATGTRITLSLAHQLRETGKTYGIASACIGGGQGIAILLKV
ncbi:MAG: thiolase family protein [Bacteriovoracaceae bacterium]|jgi:acetyl-CoA acyltransferase 2|nr:thiolase family protein [Bacteriovoracaceae bacterium]